MEYIKDYDTIMEGELYEFNLDLLTKKLTLKGFTQAYNSEKKYKGEKNEKIVLKYYELNLIGIKKLNFESFPKQSFHGFSLGVIEVWKIKDNEYHIGMETTGDLVVRCEKIELIESFEKEIVRHKAYEY